MGKPKRPSHSAIVVRKTQLTPHMLRITLGGEGLLNFPEGQDSGYVKLRLEDAAAGIERPPAIRTYTVRSFDKTANELDLDFVLHTISGPAAEWARTCCIGQSIQFGGPGPKKLVDFAANWFLLAGDMSALPAISVNLEQMPRDARGMAFVEIIHPDDQQVLDAPENLKVCWIVNPEPGEPHTLLLDAVRAAPWGQGVPSVWIAGEFSQSLAIRRFVKEERNVGRQNMYASSYWQIGQTEDGHRVNKARVAE